MVGISDVRFPRIGFGDDYGGGPVRVLIVSQYFWPENFRINDLALVLVEHGHEVVVYTGRPNNPKVFSSMVTDISIVIRKLMPAA